VETFGCACYPNTSATAPNKFAHCSCVFLGYSSMHKGLVSKSHHKPPVGLPTHRLRQVILPICLLQHTSRRLVIPSSRLVLMLYRLLHPTLLLLQAPRRLSSNNTWNLVPPPPKANVVTDKWIFKHKLKADDSRSAQSSLGSPRVHLAL
jgi:hypothetical protein